MLSQVCMPWVCTNYKWFFVCWNSHFLPKGLLMLLSMYQQLSAQLAPLHIQSREMQAYVNVVTSVSLRIQHASVKTDKNNKYTVFFLFSLLSFIFPHLPLITCKCPATCETYAMWLISKPPNLMYSLTHHCLYMFLSFMSFPCVWCVNIDQLFVSVFYQFFLAVHACIFFCTLHPSMIVLVPFNLPVAHFAPPPSSLPSSPFP